MLLSKEGFAMRTRIAPLHAWNVAPEEAVALQTRLARQLVTQDDFTSLHLLAACDVFYCESSHTAAAAVCCFTYPELTPVETVFRVTHIDYPYVPGLLTFREGPALLAAFEELTVQPDLYLFDGHGIAHPRRMGLAAHLGLWLNRPAIGCAKSCLFGSYEEPPDERGGHTFLRDRNNQVIGAALRTRARTQPVYVSPGHRIGLGTSLRIVLSCTGRYRIPEPLRQADRLAREAACK